MGARSIARIAGPLLGSEKVGRTFGKYMKWATNDWLTRDAWSAWQPMDQYDAGAVSGDGGSSSGTGAKSLVRKQVANRNAMQVLQVDAGTSTVDDQGVIMTPVQYEPSQCGLSPIVIAGWLAKVNAADTASVFFGVTDAVNPNTTSPIEAGAGGDGLAPTQSSIGVLSVGASDTAEVVIQLAGGTASQVTIATNFGLTDDALQFVLLAGPEGVWHRSRQFGNTVTAWSEGFLEAGANAPLAMGSMVGCAAVKNTTAAATSVHISESLVAQQKYNGDVFFPLSG